MTFNKVVSELLERTRANAIQKAFEMDQQIWVKTGINWGWKGEGLIDFDDPGIELDLDSFFPSADDTDKVINKEINWVPA